MKPFKLKMRNAASGGRKWAFLWLALLGLAPAIPVLATIPTYTNNAVAYYTIPGNPPPTIDAANFINNSTFTVNFETPTVNPEFYEPENTVNYTNNGAMIANAPFPTNDNIGYGFSPGAGYEFDTQISNNVSHVMAGAFYNQGAIRCDSIIDGNNILTFSFDGISYTDIFQTSFGECVVWATNIINPGNIDVGIGGLLEMTGQHVDLSRSVLTLEQSLFSSGLNYSSTGAFGLDTNGDWAPSFDLGPTTANSSLPDDLILTNSTPYFQFIVSNGGSNILVRAVFIQNTSLNAPDTVYFDPTSLGGGDVTIQWAGPYVNPATGLTATNYLYLNDDILGGSFTNLTLFNGVPDNFTLTASSTPIFIGAPATPGFYGVFNSGIVTNRYSYFNAQLIPTTEPTNASEINPNGSLTNLSNQILITAGNELNLFLAQVSGPDYMSLTATNQFDGSGGAAIGAPYSDINLGVTNGFMTGNQAISNLLQAQFLNWSGTLDAWSTRWTNTDINGITWDYRVLLVNSDVIPTTPDQVQNLRLHATNSIIISDVLNVLGTFYADAQSLTLTTNGPGNGATSLDGELNFENVNILWPSALPNLLCLTNNGAIRVGNLAQFGTGTPTYITNAMPTVPAAAATGTLSQLGASNVVNGDKVTIGSWQYAFTNHLAANTASNRVLVATTFDGSMSNLIEAINHVAADSGKTYSSKTKSNPLVAAGALANNAFTVTALAAGPAGNSIVTTTTSAHLMWSGPTLSGGANAVPGTTNVVMAATGYYNAIINDGLLSDQGSAIWADDFQSGGVISNGVGSFILTSQTVTLTNGMLIAGGDVSITAGSLLASNLFLQAGRSLTLLVTNSLTDGVTNGNNGLTNGNIWSVGSSNGTGGNGLVLPVLPDSPTNCGLLGTSIYMVSPPPNKQVSSTWAGLNDGDSTAGYTNNMAIGQLMLDVLANNSTLYFTGTGASNAMYVDRLVLLDYASWTNHNGVDVIPTLTFNTNLVIYYADAVASGEDVSYQLNGANNYYDGHGPHLIWVPEYTGYFSSTNMVYPDGTTNTFNIGLVESYNLDSNGNGIPNVFDPTPIFVRSQINFMHSMTNITGTNYIVLTWDSIPSATNTIFYRTNFMGTKFQLTSFVSPPLVPPAGGWPITNNVYEPINLSVPARYYWVGVSPNNMDVYGP